MHTSETFVSPSSEYFIYSPSASYADFLLLPSIAGDYTYLPGYHLSRTSFGSYLILFLASGELSLTQTLANGEVLHFEGTSGDLFLLNCCLPHTYETAKGCHVLWCHFNGPSMPSYYDCLQKEDRLRIHVPMHSKPADQAAFLLSQIQNAVVQNETDFPASAALSKDLYMLLSLFAEEDTAETSSAEPLAKAVSYINAHISEDLSIHILAKEAALSPYYFARSFKTYTGVSPHQYILALRMNIARYLLSSTDLTVQDITLRCGFADSSIFCAAFKRIEGVTPGDYRKKRG